MLNAAVGIALIVEKDVAALQDVFGVTDANVMVTTGVVELVIAGLLALVAWAVFSGANWARWAVAVVIAIRVAVAGVSHRSSRRGHPLDNGLFDHFGVFILWALFGNKESDEYFERTT